MNNQYASAAVLIIVALGSIFGIAVDEGVVTDIVGAALVLVSLIYGIWKDHDFTSLAKTFGTLKRAYKENDEAIVYWIGRIYEDYKAGLLTIPAEDKEVE